MPKGKLTTKQLAIVEAKINNPDATYEQLSILAGYTGRQSAYRALGTGQVKVKIAELMEGRPNLKDEALLDRLEEGLSATKRDPAGPDDLPDYSVRHKYLETGLKLKGHLDTSFKIDAPQSQILILDSLKALESNESRGTE